MRSVKPGKSTSKVEITNISQHGFWLFVKGKEYFLSFDEFPWFRDATIDDLVDVEITKGKDLYWPKLDVDLTLNIIEHPDKYPLKSKA